MEIRKLEQKDIANAVKILEEKYREDASGYLSAMFENKKYVPNYFIAIDDGEIIGFGGYVESPLNFHAYELMGINVSENMQGKGIGSAIVSHLISEIKNINEPKPECILLSTLKPKYFEKFGFSTISNFGKGLELMKLDL